ncbi:hypothetical protein J6590_061269 [Homalodisca vitripennis]|nr:hypothetical protein J6590_061269 [Homalodisca vitripennis]
MLKERIICARYMEVSLRFSTENYSVASHRRNQEELLLFCNYVRSEKAIVLELDTAGPMRERRGCPSELGGGEL